MNTQLINQIKELPGVKEVTEVNGMAVVVFEPRKPILHDEYGVPLFDNDEICYVNTNKTCFTVEYYSRNLAIGDYYPSHVKLFSTPESAQKWIDEQKKKPIYTDPEDGTEFFAGDACWWFLKAECNIRSNYIKNINVYCGSDVSSKIYKSRQLCELALAKFIMNKYK